jgi:hypothetical protein
VNLRLAAVLISIPLAAQPLRVFSEFARISASGEVVAPAEPREILSPAIPRNGFASFQIVIQTDKPWWLYVGLNPSEAVRVELYRESDGKLERMDTVPRGDSPAVFWMDLWTERDAPVRRIKVEPELRVDDDWVIYPMEVRVVDATIPDGSSVRAPLCGSGKAPEGNSAASQRFRNAQQDAALASRLSSEEVRRLTAACASPPADNPEWYLQIRDAVVRARQ